MSIFDGIQRRGSRIVRDYAQLTKLSEGIRAVQLKLVVTIGTFDMIHVGHCRYLAKAKSFGDILIVGVDTDRAVKAYKGPLRPMVPEDERLEMLVHTRDVDIVTLIDDVHETGAWKYGLLEAVRPAVFVAVEGSYPKEQLADIERYCGEVKVLPRQAETSTSEVMRRNLLAQAKPLSDRLRLLAEQLDRGEIES